MNDNITYWLSVYPPFNVGSSGIRYYLWKTDYNYNYNDKLIFSFKTKYELRIFMDLSGLKINKCRIISRDSVYHKNKIVYASFVVVNKIKDN